MGAPKTGDEVIDSVLAVAHRIRRYVDQRLREVGLSLPRLKVLELLAAEEPRRLRDLSDALGVAPRTMTATVDGLEQDHLIDRVQHPDDRRALALSLTPTGWERLAEAWATRDDVVRDLTRGLAEADRAVLLRLLAALGDAATGP